MMLHGGVIAACGTFFVFSDYMKPAVRMAALMQVPVKFIWTHDAFRVGEDGPTHEPVEQEAQIRLMEKLKNHHGQNSLLVLRPADAEETTVCWKLAMENTDTPSALILSRQNIEMLPEGNDYGQAAKGAYIVAGSDENPDVILVASGSEVSTLVAGAALLRADGMKVRIVSCPSEGLFRSQCPCYQEEILPAGAKIFGLTAGLPQGEALAFASHTAAITVSRMGAMPSLPTVEEVCANARRIAVLENVMNPTNIGAIFRCAAALGMDAVLLTAAGSDPLYRRASRVSMGNVFLIPWTYLPEEAPWPERLRRLGFQTVAMALREDSLLLNDPRLMAAEKLAVVLGTEGDGLSDGTIAACDYTVRIPMTHGVDSLNVAAASAVAFYQLGLMSGGAPT